MGGVRDSEIVCEVAQHHRLPDLQCHLHTKHSIEERKKRRGEMQADSEI